MDTKQKKHKKTQPLLYISQPKSQSILLNMQDTYIGKTEKKETVTNQVDRLISTDQNMNQSSTIHDQEVLNTEIIEKDKEQSSSNDFTYYRKPFKNMKLQEKIHYLLGKPSYIPTMSCEIITKESAYIGYVTEYIQDKIKILSLSTGSSILIDTNDIVDIRLTVR